MRALVIGANGFLGSYIVEALLRHGNQVRGLTRRRENGLQGMNVETAVGDVRDLESLEHATRDVDVVFHTAGVSGIWGPWKRFHSINTVGTQNVIEACIRNRVRRLVYTSSPSVIFDGEHQRHANESLPYPRRWLCNYSRSKAMAEQQVLQVNDSCKLMTCALRPHLIWGKGDRHLVPRLLQRAKSKQLRRVGDGSNQIDMIHVENAAFAHLQAAQALEPGSPVCGSVYFLSQNDPVNCWNWINEILVLAGLPKVRQSISFYWAYRLGAALETYHEIMNLQSEPRMTRFLAAQLAKNHYYDISRAQMDFGYSPKISTELGMRQLAEHLNGTR
jgi:nucleoside-diphosphate-sugar epimerase